MPKKYVRKTDRREMTPEHRAKISAAVKARYANPEERAKTAATLKEFYADPAVRAKSAEKARAWTAAHNARVAKALALLEAQEREADRG